MPPRKETEVVDKEKRAGGDDPSAVIDAEPGAVAAATEALGAAVTANQQSEQGAADAEGQHKSALDGIDNIIDQLQLSTGELVFDVRDEMIEIIKHRPKPWSATSQIEQREVAARVEEFGKKLIRQIVEAVASQGQKPIRVLLTKVNAGGDDIVVTGKVKFLDAEPSERDDAILSLHHAIGKHVMMTRASVDDYMGGNREAQTDADEPPLDFEAGAEEDDSEA